MMIWCPAPWRRALMLGAAGLPLMLAACADSERSADGGGSDRDPLGGIFGDVLGRGGSDALAGVLGGVLARRVSYRCDDRRGFSASFEPLSGGASVEAEGRDYKLQAPASGGDSYRREYVGEGGTVRLITDGDAAELHIRSEDGRAEEGRGEDDLDLTNCRAAPTQPAADESRRRPEEE